jgi:hypothetical protein
MLICWMLICAGGAAVVWNGWFAAGDGRRQMRVGAPWFAALLLFAFLPVAGAVLHDGVVYGPFDTNLPNLPWAGGGGPAYSPKSGVLNDVTLQFAPWQAEVRRQLLAGRLPLLNRWSGAGQPLLGNGQAAPFSLVSLSALPFDAVRAQGLRAFLKLFLALLGTFAAARQLGCRPIFALLAAVAYGWGGSLAVWQLFPHAEVMALFPFAFLAVERLLAVPDDRRAGVLLLLAAGAIALSGHPETALTGGAALAGRLAFAACSGERLAVRGAARGAALLALALLATTFFTLPLAQSILGSEKLAHQGHGRPAVALPGGGPAWASAVNLASPGIFGTPQGSQEHGPAPLHWLAEGSVGLACMALAAAAILGGALAGPAGRHLAGLALAAFLVHLDLAGLAGRLFALPYLSALDRRYFAFLGGFAVALLAARGLDSWCRPSATAADAPGDGGTARCSRRLRLAFWGCAGAALAWALATRWVVLRSWARQGWVEPPAAAAGRAALAECTQHWWVGIGVALGLLFCLALWRRPALAGLLAVALAAGQLYDGYGGYVPVVPAATAYPTLPVLDRLRQEPCPFRLAGTRGVFFPNNSTWYQLADLRTHDPVEPARYVDFLVELLDLDRTTYKKQYRQPLPRHLVALRLLGTRFLLARGDLALGPPWVDRGLFGSTRLWRLGGDTRWAFFPTTVVGAADAASARRVVRAMTDPYREAVLETAAGAGPPRAPDPAPDPAPNGEARVEQLAVEADGGLRLAVRVTRDAWLVVSQAAIPGWRARADGGAALPTAVADGALLAVWVPAGARQVELRYLPASFLAGVGFSITALAAACALLLRWRRQDGIRKLAAVDGLQPA